MFIDVRELQLFYMEILSQTARYDHPKRHVAVGKAGCQNKLSAVETTSDLSKHLYLSTQTSRQSLGSRAEAFKRNSSQVMQSFLSSSKASTSLSHLDSLVDMTNKTSVALESKRIMAHKTERAVMSLQRQVESLQRKERKISGEKIASEQALAYIEDGDSARSKVGYQNGVVLEL